MATFNPRRPRAEPPEAAAPKGTAHACALRLLLGRPLSACELRARLAERGFAADAIDVAIDSMRRYHYIDDVKLGDMVRASAERQGKGPQWIANNLARRGVEADIVRQAARVPEQQSLAQAKALVARRFAARHEVGTEKIRRRALRFLASRGFAGHCAYAAVKAVLAPPQAGDTPGQTC